MSGRRLRDTIRNKVESLSNRMDTKVVVAGLSNTYTHYITTFEEYQKQRYEAASTLYGPHTLQAYQQQYTFLVENLVQNKMRTKKCSRKAFFTKNSSVIFQKGCLSNI